MWCKYTQNWNVTKKRKKENVRVDHGSVRIENSNKKNKWTEKEVNIFVEGNKINILKTKPNEKQD